ncbi:hypothetical protein HYV50_01070 [Candidatus Pacearchaeota archaeon]|nr:hypothetical protein [Candidatus Pacearchaeota archaeon]
MGTLDEVEGMIDEGMSEQEVFNNLKRKGLADREIQDVISRAKIRGAVAGEDDLGQERQTSQAEETGEEMPLTPSPGESLVNYPTMQSFSGPAAIEYSEQPKGYEGMQPSMVEQEQGGERMTQEYAEGGQQDYGGYDQYAQSGMQGGEYGGYGQTRGYQQQYQPYQEAMSSDVISEIAEQVVSEKLSLMHDKLEKALDFRTTAEAKMSDVEDRLKRIEKIIERVEIAVLQKVGEYVNDVKDIKTELEETQKSFGALVGKPVRERKKKEGHHVHHHAVHHTGEHHRKHEHHVKKKHHK